MVRFQRSRESRGSRFERRPLRVPAPGFRPLPPGPGLRHARRDQDPAPRYPASTFTPRCLRRGETAFGIREIAFVFRANRKMRREFQAKLRTSERPLLFQPVFGHPLCCSSRSSRPAVGPEAQLRERVRPPRVRLPPQIFVATRRAAPDTSPPHRELKSAAGPQTPLHNGLRYPIVSTTPRANLPPSERSQCSRPRFSPGRRGGPSIGGEFARSRPA